MTAALRCGPITLDPRTLEVRIVGVLVEMRASELKLLQVFLEHPGRLFTRKELLQRVWGGEDTASGRKVDVAMHRLRSALGVVGNALETIPDAGYRLRADGMPPS